MSVSHNYLRRNVGARMDSSLKRAMMLIALPAVLIALMRLFFIRAREVLPPSRRWQIYIIAYIFSAEVEYKYV